jgi:hypothetical protein
MAELNFFNAGFLVVLGNEGKLPALLLVYEFIKKRKVILV